MGRTAAVFVLLSLVATAPAGAVCSDGIIELGEACDDGNLESRGWCSADCSATSGPPLRLYGAGDDGTVYVLDVVTQLVVASIPDAASGGFPRLDLAPSPDGSRVAVVNADAGSVTVIATATNTIVDALLLDPYDLSESALAFAPDGQTLYVTADESLILAVDVSSGLIDRTFDSYDVECPDGSTPQRLGALVASHDGRRLYASTSADSPQVVVAADLDAGSLACLPLTDDEDLAFATGAEYPHLAISPDDKQLFVTSDLDIVWLTRLATKSGKQRNLVSESYNPATGLAITCDGAAVYALVAPGPTAVSAINPLTLMHSTGPGLGIDENPKYTALTRDGTTFFWGDEAPGGFSWTDLFTNTVTTVDVGASIGGIGLVTAPPQPGSLCGATPRLDCLSGFAAGSLLVNERHAGKEKLIAKFAKGPASSQSDFGNPLRPPCGTTAYALCLYDGTDGLVGSLGIDRAGYRCGTGDLCWGSVAGDPPGGKGFGYKDAAAATDGVKKLRLRSGASGETKLALKAVNDAGALPLGLAAALDGSTQATMQLVSSDARCFSVVLDRVKKSGGGLFKAAH